jgi:hypothetical protein
MRPKYETCPFCNDGRSLMLKSYATVIDKKVRTVEVFQCGTEVSFFWKAGKNRAEWIKTCRVEASSEKVSS